MANTRRVPSRAALIAGGLARGLAKSLALSILLLGPGMVLLVLHLRLAGVVALFAGSFVLMALSYRKAWRLGVVSCIIPPLTALLCYGVQMWLFGGILPPLWGIGVAVLAGGGLGLLRGRAHRIYRDERGAIMAKRTLGFIVFWVVCYAATQAFGYLQRDMLLRGGLLTGAFSSGMLAGVSLVLLARLLREKSRSAPPPMPAASGALAALGIGFLTLLASAASLRAQGPAPGTILDELISAEQFPIHGDEVVPSGTKSDPDHAMRKFLVIRGTHTQVVAMKRTTMPAGSMVTVALREFESTAACRSEGRTVIAAAAGNRELQRDSRHGWVESTVYRTPQWNRSLGVGHASGLWRRTSAFSQLRGWQGQADDHVSHACVYTGRWLIAVSATYDPYAMSSGRPGPTAMWEWKARRQTVANNWEAHDAHEAAEAVALHVYNGLVTEGLVDPAQDGLSSGAIGSIVGAVLGSAGIPGGAWESVDQKADAAEAAIIGILVAAGVAASIAQAIAAALAGAVQAGAEVTTQTIGEAVDEALGGKTGATFQPGAAPLFDPVSGKELKPNPDGRYWNSEKGCWMSRPEMERDIALRRRGLAEERSARAREVARHERETGEALARSRAAGHRRDAEFLRELHRDRAGLRAIERFDRLMRAAGKLGMTGVLDRADVNRVVDGDGNVDGAYLDRIRRIMGNRLSREEAAPQHTLEDYTGQWVVESVSGTMTDASRNVVVRIGAGWMTGGTSEGVFQAWTAGAAMKEAAEQSADRGEDMGFGDGLRVGRDTLVRENLPVASWENYQRWKDGKPVSWADVGLGLASDALTAVGLGDDLRNIGHGLRGGRAAMKNVAADWSSGTASWSRTRTHLGNAWEAARNQASGSTFTTIRNRLPERARDALDQVLVRGSAAARSAGQTAGSVMDTVGIGAGTRQKIWDTLTTDLAAPKGAPDLPGARGRRLTPDEARAVRDTADTLPDTQEAINRMHREGLSGRGAALDDAFHRGRAAGRQKVARLTGAVDDLDAAKKRGLSGEELDPYHRRVHDETLRVQADKHAMNELNSLPRAPDGTNRTIQDFNQKLDDMYAETDRRLRQRLADELTEQRVRERVAREQGITLEEAAVRPVDSATWQRIESEVRVRPEDIDVLKITNQKGAGERIDTRAPLRDHYGLGTDAQPGGRAAGTSRPGVREAAPSNRVHDESWKPAEAAPDGASAASGEKAGMDRDLTARIKVERQVPVLENGKPVMRDGKPVMRTEASWMDVPNTVTQRIYNEELYKVARRTEHLPLGGSKGAGFINVHLNARDHLNDILDVHDVDKFARKLDQATTDRLHPEAYGAGQADLDTSTKDAFRGRDLIANKGTAKTIEFKVHHWANEVDELARMADQRARGAAKLQARLDGGKLTGQDAVLARRKIQQLEGERLGLLGQAAAHQEEGIRQLVKQYDNMAITRTDAMITAGNAPGATISRDLADKVNVLRSVQQGRLTPAQAEDVLRRLGTDTRTVATQLSAHVEGLQDLRPRTREMTQVPVRNIYRPEEDDGNE